MKVPEECKCKVCKSIFCCSLCRIKHEISEHAIRVRTPRIIGTVESNTCGTSMAGGDIIYILCPICQQKPFALRADLHDELLAHIEEKHLPLRCQKCNKLYSNIDDLKEFTKCLNLMEKCQSQESSISTDRTCDTDTSKDTVKQAPVAHSTMSTQTSPFRGHNQTHKDFNDTDHLTPISIINMRWKAKSKVTHEEFISDSVSSIKNLSTVSNNSLRRSITQLPPTMTKGKLIRSTSTPLQVDTVSAKPKEPTFNASGGHVSSIYNSGLESEHSPAGTHTVNGTPAQAVDNMNRYRKVGARGKMSAVTPLRQVMSKSIQKAFVEHGGLPRCSTLQRKNMFDVTDNSTNDSNSAHSEVGLGYEAAVVPLDLRLSPAVRRTQSEGCSGSAPNSKCTNNREILMLSSQKRTTLQSIVITRTKVVAANVATSTTSTSSASARADMTGNGSSSNHSGSSNGTSTNSVYKSCESVEIITATSELSAINVAAINSAPPLTPIARVPGAVINKKLIKFETPVKEAKNTETDDGDASVKSSTPDEKFFTPNPSTPARSFSLDQNNNSNDRKKSVVRQLSHRFSPPKPRARLRDCSQFPAFSRVERITDDPTEYDVDDAFLPEKESTKQELKKPTQHQEQGAGRLWTLMTSVMRLPKFKSASSSSAQRDDSASLPDANSISIMKRCASIAGSLVRPKPMYDEDQIKPMKRKRTQTLDNHSSYSSPTFSYTDPVSPSHTSTKRIRIQSRKPIERMRLNS